MTLRLVFGLILISSFLHGETKEDVAFSAKTISGESVSLRDLEGRLKLVCFLGTECPLAYLYAPELQRIADDYADEGLSLIGIQSNVQDSPEMIRKYVRKTGVTFPMVSDQSQAIADRFGATRTPEVFLLNESLEIVYRGRIDDQYEPGVSRAKAGREDLRIAIEESLAGKAIAVSKTEPEGCLIGRESTQAGSVESVYTYHRDVVPVLNRNCIECHRSGQIGPFSMTSYRRVSGWADTMLETIEDGRMPPWHADPDVGNFHNARVLSDEDRKILFDWVAAGKPEGNPSEAPPPVEFMEGWQLGEEPDQIVEMRDYPFVVPKEGTVEYQYFVTDPGFTEDRWIRAAEVIPGNRSVVHHCIVFVRPPDGEGFRGANILTGYVPGQRVYIPPSNYARRVKAGSKLVFQMHYTPRGREEEDLTKVGVVFAEESEVTREVFSFAALQHEFEIPPHESHYPVSASLRWLPEGGELLSISPHMHYRGKSFAVHAGEGKINPLLRIPSYDFNWQHTYILENPLPLDGIERIEFDAVFDNSDANPFNPDPSEWVTWGDQTWEEMALAFFDIAVPRSGEGMRRSRPKPSGASEKEIEAYVERCFAEMDLNGDGVIRRKEAPAAARLRWFRFVDENEDQRVTREELRARGLSR